MPLQNRNKQAEIITVQHLMQNESIVARPQAPTHFPSSIIDCILPAVLLLLKRTYASLTLRFFTVNSFQ